VEWSTGAVVTYIRSDSSSVVEKQRTEAVLLHCASNSICQVQIVVLMQKEEYILVSCSYGGEQVIILKS